MTLSTVTGRQTDPEGLLRLASTTVVKALRSLNVASLLRSSSMSTSHATEGEGVLIFENSSADPTERDSRALNFVVESAEIAPLYTAFWLPGGSDHLTVLYLQNRGRVKIKTADAVWANNGLLTSWCISNGSVVCWIDPTLHSALQKD